MLVLAWMTADPLGLASLLCSSYLTQAGSSSSQMDHPWGSINALHFLFPWQHTCHLFQTLSHLSFLNHDSPTSLKTLCHRLFPIVSSKSLVILKSRNKSVTRMADQTHYSHVICTTPLIPHNLEDRDTACSVFIVFHFLWNNM